jgi:hypothetical protein
MPFVKGKSGNPDGKPKGAKHEKTKQWEALGEMIVGDCTDKVMQYLNDLWRKDKEAYFKAYTLLLEYFKPKQARTEIVGDEDKPLHIKQDLDLSKMPPELLRELMKYAVKD